MASETATLSRAQRKKQAARSRIISEAEKLLRTGPVETVTIQDITDAADVGHGTFYLHFKSKHEVLIPIIQQAAEKIDLRLQAYFDDHEDPAFVVCQSARIMGRAVLADPLWRWMIEHSGMPVEDMRSAVGRFASRDFGKGLMTGRFTVPDMRTASAVILGGYVNGLLSAFESDDPEAAIDVTAELQMRLLGISARESAELAHRPLSELDTLLNQAN